MSQHKKDIIPQKEDENPTEKPKKVSDPVLPVQYPPRNIPDENPIVIGDPTNPIVDPILKKPIIKPFNAPIIEGNTQQSLPT